MWKKKHLKTEQWIRCQQIKFCPCRFPLAWVGTGWTGRGVKTCTQGLPVFDRALCNRLWCRWVLATEACVGSRQLFQLLLAHCVIQTHWNSTQYKVRFKLMIHCVSSWPLCCFQQLKHMSMCIIKNSEKQFWPQSCTLYNLLKMIKQKYFSSDK